MRLTRYAPVVLAALLFAPSAHAAANLVYGVNDDSARNWAVSGAPIHELGVQQVAVTIQWRQQLTVDGGELGSIPVSQPVLVVVSGCLADSPTSPAARRAFGAYLKALVWAHPNVREISVWNEPTEPWSWTGSLRQYLWLVAAARDSVPRQVKVLAPGSHPTISRQLTFVHAVRSFYRATHRRQALFDGYAAHPYWDWRSTGLIARAMNRLWRGLPQPSPGRGLRFWWTETGMESDPDAVEAQKELYTGTLPHWVLSGSADQQAARVAVVARQARRDPLVVADFNFLLWDERNLDGWQSGLLWADGTRKPAFYSFRDAVRAATGPSGHATGSRRSHLKSRSAG